MLPFKVTSVDILELDGSFFILVVGELGAMVYKLNDNLSESVFVFFDKPTSHAQLMTVDGCLSIIALNIDRSCFTVYAVSDNSYNVI